jgi:(2Fe-2S) ferredoxin
MVIYPENWWYGKIENESAIDEIIDALEAGRTADHYLI